jgi:hypothetical protein
MCTRLILCRIAPNRPPLKGKNLNWIKGRKSRDFWALVFFLNLPLHIDPWNFSFYSVSEAEFHRKLLRGILDAGEIY